MSLEIIGLFFGILFVFFAANNKSIAFIFGFISSFIYVYISFLAHYYYDVVLNFYYVLIAIFGFRKWKNIEKQISQEKTIKRLGLKRNSIYLIGLLFITLILGFFSEKYSKTILSLPQSDLPYLDAFTTVFALFGAWLQVNKYIENWYYFIFVNIVALTMYWQKTMYPTAFLFLLYTLFAVYGAWKWRKYIIKK